MHILKCMEDQGPFAAHVEDFEMPDWIVDSP